MHASLIWAVIAVLSLLAIRGFNNWYREPASGRRLSPGPLISAQEGHQQVVNVDEPGRISG